MTSAYILIAAILVLGGLIAALGDRLGSKVGKARLRLFNLRPRQTAALVTVITGTTIAASTLMLLFGLSESLREGVFELDDILKKRRAIKAELEQVKDEKNEFEEELKATQKEQEEAQQRLDEINQKFLQAQEKLTTVSNQASTLRKDISSLLEEREELLEQKENLGTQIEEFREQVAEQDREIASQKNKLAQQQENLQAQEKVLANQQNSLDNLQQQQRTLQTEIAQRDEALQEKQEELQEKQNNLETLEKQLTFLRNEVSILENNYQGLRATDIALVRGQILASTVVKVDNPVSAQQRILRLLQLANQVATERSLGGSSQNQERVIQIADNQVQDLVKRISDNREYVVRIVSAGNYVKGETEVRVFPDAIPNKRVFQAGEVIAAISFDSEYPTLEEIQRQIDWLMSASQFRVRRAGILGNIQIEDGSLLQLVDFVDQITEFEDSIEEIRTVATQGIYTAGPAKISLVALKDGKVVLRTH